MDFEAGHLLSGKYRIIRRIGVGGMGSVYEARHEGLATTVALKVLLPQLAQVPTVADRFRREAQVSATLESPHVIRVMDVDQLPDGRPYIVMELLRGESLQAYLSRVKSLGREEAVDLGLQILLGLESAHALGVVHRDLKPGNVFLDEGAADLGSAGRVAKLLDFGVAKLRATPELQALTRPGMVMGTPEYMAPEQAFSADQADARSDLYSVAVLLYEMLSGELPAKGDIPLAVAHQVMTGQVRPLAELCPGLPQGLLNLVQRGMQPDRGARFESATEMRRALSAFAGELSAAGRVAASVALGERPGVQVLGGPLGTEKVPAFASRDVGPVAEAPSPAPRTGEKPGSAASEGAARAAAALAVGAHPPPAPAAAPPALPAAPPVPESPPAPAAAPPAAASPAPAAAPPAATAEMSRFAGAPRSAPAGPPAAAKSPAAPGPGPHRLAATAEMPEAPGGVAPTLSTPSRPRRGLGRKLLIGLLCLGALAGGGLGVLYLLDEAGLVQLAPDPGPPPPMPQPQPGARFEGARPASDP